MALLAPNIARNRMLFMGPGLTTPAVVVSKDGGAFASPAGALTAVGTVGWYELALTAADTDTPGDLAYHFSAAAGTPTADPEPDQVSAPVLLADGVAHGGAPGSSSATLSCESMYIVNTGGTALTLTGGFGGRGVDCRGGTGGGVYVQGGTGSVGIYAESGGTQAGIYALGGIQAIGTGSGAGIYAQGNDAGPGIRAEGGGGGAGVYATGQGAAPAVQLGDGVSGGVGLVIQSAAGDGVTVTGAVNGATITGAGADALDLYGSSKGLYVYGAQDAVAFSGADGAGLSLIGTTADLLLAGAGTLAGDLTGRVLGASATAFSGPGVQLDPTQPVPTSNVPQSVGDALSAARAQGFGRWTIVGTVLTLYAADGTTAVRTFALDSATAPTSRT